MPSTFLPVLAEVVPCSPYGEASYPFRDLEVPVLDISQGLASFNGELVPVHRIDSEVVAFGR